jgi:hypothetical protein
LSPETFRDRKEMRVPDINNDVPRIVTYVSILTVEAAIILLLWVLERLYGSR